MKICELRSVIVEDELRREHDEIEAMANNSVGGSISLNSLMKKASTGDLGM